MSHGRLKDTAVPDPSPQLLSLPQQSPHSLWLQRIPYLIPVLLVVANRLFLTRSISDDAFISFRLAHNLAMGNGMHFNPGEAIYVTTSPLWVLLIAGMRFFVGDTIQSAILLGSILDVLVVLSLMWFARASRDGAKLGLIAAILLYTNPYAVFASLHGMETPLYLLTMIVSAGFLVRRRHVIGLVVGALSVWVRFDGLMFYAVAVAWSVYDQRYVPKKNLPRQFIQLLPSLGILAAYATLGTLVFGDALPMSVRDKTYDLPTLLSPDWIDGATASGREFLKSFSFSGRHPSPIQVPPFLFFIPLGIGLTSAIRQKDWVLLLLAAFAVINILALVGSGSPGPQWWSWYFVPFLPGAYLIVSKGLISISSFLADRFLPFSKLRQVGLVMLIPAMAWPLLNWSRPLAADANYHRHGVWGAAGREQVYAACAIWAGRHLPHHSQTVAIEIGAYGFFLPMDSSILDVAGILRIKRDFQRDWVDMVEEYSPELVVSKPGFHVRSQIEATFPGTYDWTQFQTVDIGIRKELSAKLLPKLSELPALYEEVDLLREYPWESKSRE